MTSYLHNDLMKRCTGKYKPLFRYPAHVIENWKEDTKAQARSIDNVKKREKAISKETKNCLKREKNYRYGGYNKREHTKIRIAAKKIYSKFHLIPFYTRQNNLLIGDIIPMQRTLFYSDKTAKDLEKDINRFLEEEETGLKAKINSADNNIGIIELKASEN